MTGVAERRWSSSQLPNSTPCRGWGVSRAGPQVTLGMWGGLSQYIPCAPMGGTCLVPHGEKRWEPQEQGTEADIYEMCWGYLRADSDWGNLGHPVKQKTSTSSFPRTPKPLGPHRPNLKAPFWLPALNPQAPGGLHSEAPNTLVSPEKPSTPTQTHTSLLPPDPCTADPTPPTSFNPPALSDHTSLRTLGPCHTTASSARPNLPVCSVPALLSQRGCASVCPHPSDPGGWLG